MVNVHKTMEGTVCIAYISVKHFSPETEVCYELCIYYESMEVLLGTIQC